MNKTTLVLGASPNPNRYSNRAVVQLRAKNIPVIAYGKREGTIADVKINLTLEKWEDVDTISLYVSAKNQNEFYNYIIDLKPKRVIFNPGTENPELEELLEKHGVFYEHACTLVLLGLGTY